MSADVLIAGSLLSGLALVHILDRIGLSELEQFSLGAQLYENEAGQLQKRLCFGGSETDREFDGYLEGTVKAAETVLAKLSH